MGWHSDGLRALVGTLAVGARTFEQDLIERANGI
jgi:hypothetical protein